MFIYLENYLKIHGYNYKFTMFVNQWSPDIESTDNGDYSLGWFATDMDIYKNFKFDNWFFVDDQKNCFYEYAKKRHLLGPDKFHPLAEAHQLFAENIVLPIILEE